MISRKRVTPRFIVRPEDLVRRVGTRKAYISFKGRLCRVPKAFAGERVAIRPRGEDGQFGVFFGATRIAEIDLRL